MRGLKAIIFGGIMLLATTHVHAALTYGTDIPEDKIPLQGLKYRYKLGFDLSNMIMHPINDFQYIAYNYHHGMDLYASYRTRGPLGFELGYHWTTDHPKNFSTVPGTQMFGATATTTATYQCKMRIENYYIDGYWHYKIRKIAEWFLGIGVGFQRQNMVFYNPSNNIDPVQQAFSGMYTGTTLTARFNIGIQTMFTGRFGGRVLFSYETTSGISCRNVLQGVDPHMFGNAYTYGIGLFYTITGYYD